VGFLCRSVEPSWLSPAKRPLDPLLWKTEMSRFLIVGAINFVFTFVIFTLTLKILNGHYAASLLLAWSMGNILTYILNFVWVFQPEKRLNFRGRFFKYLTAGAFSIILNLLTLSAFVEVGKFDPFWSQCFIMPFVIIFNFGTAKLWSLRKTR
jgi:putative flippase GtrA